MKKRRLVLSAAAIALFGGLAIAQTMEGMDHSNMGGMGDMGMMSHMSLIPPELADNPSAQAYAAAMDKMMADMMVPYTGDADRGLRARHDTRITKRRSPWRRSSLSTARIRKSASSRKR